MVKYKCGVCNYTTDRKSSYDDHNKRKTPCKDENQQLREENKTLKEQIELLKNRSVNITNNTTNTTNTMNGDIIVNNYLNTNYSIVIDQINQIKCKNIEDLFIKFMEIVHFNKDCPENHNIKIENSKTNSVSVLKDGSFEELGRGNDVIDKIINTKMDDIIIERENEKCIKNDIIFKVSDYTEEETDEKRKTLTKLRTRLKTQLYNGRKMVNDTHK